MGFPDGSLVKNPPVNARNGSGRFPGGGNGNPLQYSCWDNSMDRRVWQATVHGSTKIELTEHAHKEKHSFN